MDIDSDTKPSPSTLKTPVVRGARACTVCRNAKMKCVGADDGDKPCQRCKRAGVPCVFEKHRRGRKPGSKLSEASKMLRRLEKGLNTAKLKSQSAEASPASPYPPSDLRPPSESYSTTLRSAEPSYAQPPQPTSPHYAQPPPQQLPPPPPPAPPPAAASAYQNGDSSYASAFQGNRNDANPEDEDDDDVDRTESIYPAKFIQNQRNSFFRTILNPHDAPAQESNANNQKASSSSPPSSSSLIPQPRPPGPLDPVAAGILHETDTKVLFDQLFLRLNPFINLFDPALHTAPYVRSKCPFLFTTLLMVSCRFWRPAVFKQCQKLAHEFSVLAFAEAWKRIEVVQAFACLTYWKDPDDNRTWTYIGYACRMAVELGLNRYVAHPPVHETELQRLERRNRERTYLVLFIHDRSLSTQTGRHWMLPEGDLVKHSATWHLGGIKGIVRPEDVIISAFVQLRLIAAETTDVFSAATKGNSDINYDVVLRNTNAKLTEWDEKWRSEMTKAKGEGFHLSFLSFFRLYVRLFLNSFGIQATLLPGSRVAPSIQALSTCWKSALDSLQILSDDFVKMSMLCYCQDSILVMSAYSAVFLLKLLSTQSIYQHLGESTANEIYRLIEKAGKAYVGAGSIPKATISTEYHGGFLQSLLSNDIFRHRQPQAKQEETDIPVDPRMQNQVQQNPGPVQASPVQPSYPQQVAARPQEQLNYSYANPVPTHQSQSIQHNYHNAYAMQQQRQQQAMEHQQNYGYDPTLPSAPHNATELEANYWKNMFIELGFGQTNDGPPTNVLAVSNTSDVRCMPPAPEYIENHHAAQHQLVMQQHHHHQQQQQQAHMYHMHHHQQVAVHQGYGH